MLEETKRTLKQKYPKFEVRPKKGSKLMKLIHWFLLIITFGQMKTFMSFITTIGYVVYVPEHWETKSGYARATVLVHEGRHMHQKDHHFMFSLRYLFWPLPFGYANFRLEMEADAYAEGIVFSHREFGTRLYGQRLERACQALSGPEYFWPTFSYKKARKTLEECIIKKMGDSS